MDNYDQVNADVDSNKAIDYYRYELPLAIPIFEKKDDDYYQWVLAAIFSTRYKAGMSRQEFIDRIQQGYDAAVKRDDEYLIKHWPKPDEMEYLLDYFAIYVRYVSDKAKHFKVFRD